MLRNILLFLREKVHLKGWEIAKYFLISCMMFAPALISYFNHIENEYYVKTDNLLSFFAFTSAAFSLLVLCRIPRKWTIPLILFSMACAAYHIAIGKPIGFQTMAAIYETNLPEIVGFLSSPYSLHLILAGVVGLGAAIWYVTRDKPIFKLTGDTHIRRHYLLWLSILSVWLFVREGKAIVFTYPIAPFYSNYCYITESCTQKGYLSATYSFKGRTRKAFRSRPPEIGILIIGEAARRSSLHAYGYPLDTTPRLDALIETFPQRVILFRDAISVSAYTRGSVPSMLSTFDLPGIKRLFRRPSLSKMFRGAGFRTLYVTARPRYRRPNIVSIFQDDAEETVYLKNTLRERKYDEDCLPVIRRFIHTHESEKRFIIFHLLGSHIKYSMKYPPSRAFFKTGYEMIDTYDNSIRYSDFVIQQVVDMVMKQPVPGFVLYASDHGENLNDYGDGNYGHGTREFTRFEFEIPFIVYVNEPFLKRYPERVRNLRSRVDKPISQAVISHTFLGVFGIEDDTFYNPSEDLSSPQFTPKTRFIIDENMNTYDYDSLKLYKRKIPPKIAAL